MQRALRVLVLLPFAAGARAQSTGELDLTASPATGQPSPARPPAVGVPSPALPPPPMDFADGPPVVALPLLKSPGRLDLESSRVLHAALQERLGARLVSFDETVRVVEVEKLGKKLGTIAAREKLAARLRASLLVVLEASGAQLEARLLPGPASPPVAEASVGLGRGKRVSQALARVLVEALLTTGRTTLQPEPVVDLTAGAPPSVANGPEDRESVETQALGLRPRPPPEPLGAPRLLVAVGAGPGFRSLSAVSTSPAIAQPPPVMASLGVTAAVFPLRFVPTLAHGVWGDLWLQAAYRRNLVQARVGDGDAGVACPVSDDEILGRAGYRYALGARLPRVGVGAGVAWERTAFACEVSTLNTAYGSTELHLEVLQPVLGEALTAELSVGPRLLFSTRAAGRETLAFSGELWVTGRLARYFLVRAGSRVTSTRLTTWPEGIGVTDVRVFVGVEVGAAL